jgi:hypothetical protein
MEGHGFLYFYLNKFLIYFHVFISKKIIIFKLHFVWITFFGYLTMPTHSKYSFIYFAYMDSTRLYQQSGIVF